MEASASLEIAKHTLLSCGMVLAIGTVAGLIAQKIRIPDVAVFLITGIAIGPHALGLVDIKADSALNQIILLFGASYILFDGGASLRFNVLKQVWITIVVIATVGVVITAADHRPRRLLHPRRTLDRGAAAGGDAGLDRSGDAGADLPSGPHSRPRRANRDERVRLQRRHGRDRHLRRAGGGDRQRRVLASLSSLLDLLKQSVDRHRRRHRARLSRRARHRP